MALDSDDLKAIKNLLVPIEDKIFQIEDQMAARFQSVDERFNSIDANFEALFKRDESREQEYLVLGGQMSRVEERLTSLEKKIA